MITVDKFSADVLELIQEYNALFYEGYMEDAYILLTRDLLRLVTNTEEDTQP